MKNELKTYTIGTRCFCDFPFGLPHGKVVEIIKPGNGKDCAGLVKVRLTQTVGAYRKGETLDVSTFTAVPMKQKLPLKSGQFFTRISTLYRYE